MKKKVLSILLTLTMCLSLLPATALATDSYPKSEALNVKATTGNGQITVTWSALEAVGTDTVKSYTVYCYIEDEDYSVSQNYASAGSHTFENLTNGVTYSVGVTATYTVEGEYGPETVDSEVEATPLNGTETAPDAPTEVSATANDDGSVEVCWKAPTNDGGAAITGYEVDVSFTSGEESGGKTEEVGANATSCTIDGLTGGVTYTVVVRAINAVGSTDSTTPTTVTVPVVEYNLKVEGIPVTNVNADDVLVDGGSVKYAPETNTLTLTDATISNSDGDGITVDGIDITIHGVDTDANGSNQISGSVNAIKGSGDITITGALGNILGGSNGGIYSTGGDIQIAEGAVVGDVSSDWYAIQTDAGNITIDGTVGNISGVIGITSEYSHDTTINGKVGNITGTDYGIFAYKNLNITKDAEVGDISGTIGGMIAFADVTISGKTGNISGTTYGAYAIGGTLTIDGQVSQFSGQCPIRTSGNINISGTVDKIIGASYGIYTDGMLSISVPVEVTAPNGFAVAVGGGFLLTNVIITEPANHVFDTIEMGEDEDGETIYFNAIGTSVYDEANGDDVFTPAKMVKFVEAYAVTFDVGESTDLIDSQEVVKDGVAVKPVDPTLSGYIFGGWYTDAACTTAYDFDTPVTGDITLYAKWTQRSTGGGSSSGNTTTKTEKNEDGSTTTTTTNKSTGTVTETTKNTDGSSTTVVTTKDGEVTTTEKTADGVTGTTVTDADGNTTEVSAKVPASAAKDAEENGEAVTLPIEVEAADDADEAVEIEIDVPSGGAKVEIPVTDVTPGTVVVIVNKDGTEEIVKTSAVSDTGVVVTLNKDATVKVIDNSKYFVDVHPVDHWAENAIDFVVAREIYSGTSATTFHPDNTMTRGMLAVVLHRLENTPDHNYTGSFTDVAEDSWYEDAIHWAADNGIVGGYGNGLYGPNDNITREQLAVMLWRYAGSPDSSHGLSHFVDEDQISNYARVALAWANENGIINGKGNNILDPKGNATRAQVAQMLKNFIENIM